MGKWEKNNKINSNPRCNSDSMLTSIAKLTKK
jgi:hypothetical protein